MLKIKLTLLSLLVLPVCFGNTINAQQAPREKLVIGDSILLDPSTKYGKLFNGFTYYIKRTDDSPGKLRMELIIKAGLDNSRPDEPELAHLLEHMPFKGTKSFDNAWEYFQSKGVERAWGINASTGFNRTIYYLDKIPSRDTALIADGMKFFKEISNEMLLRPENMETEKRALLAEMSLNEEDMLLARDFYNLKLLRQSGAAGLDVIERKKLMLQLSPETVRRFYEKWYRPELECVIVIGDINEKEIEKKIWEFFSGIPARAEELSGIPQKFLKLDDSNRLYTYAHKSVMTSDLAINFKYPYRITKTAKDYRENALKDCYNIIMEKRMKMLSKNYEGSFSFFRSAFENKFNTRELPFGALTFSVYVNDNDIKTAFITIVKELQRVKKFGFTHAEFSEAMQKVKNRLLEQAVESVELRELYRNHFLEGEAVPGPDYTRNFLLPMLDNISLADFNYYIQQQPLNINRDIVIRVPEQFAGKVPDNSKINAWLKEAYNSPVQPFKYRVEDKLSLNKLPQFQNLRTDAAYRRTDHKELNIVQLNLLNGVTVYMKPIKGAGGVEVEMVRPGGAVGCKMEDSLSASLSGELISRGNIAGLSAAKINTFKSQNGIYLSPHILWNSEGISGSAKKENIEPVFQLIRLYMQGPFELAPEEYEKWLSEKKSAGSDAVSDFNMFMNERFKTINKSGIPQHYFNLSQEDISLFNLKRATEIYRNKMNNAYGFDLVISGEFDTDKVIPLVLKYVGTLPSKPLPNPSVNIKELAINSSRDVYKVPSNDSIAAVNFDYLGSYDGKTSTALRLDLLAQMVETILYKKLREEEGATYAVNAGVKKYNHGKGYFDFSIGFRCQRSVANKVVDFCIDELRKLSESSDSNALQIAKLQEIARLTEGKNSADFWKGYLVQQVLEKRDLNEILNREELINAVTCTDIETTAREVLNKEKLKVFIFMPEH